MSLSIPAAARNELSETYLLQAAVWLRLDSAQRMVTLLDQRLESEVEMEIGSLESSGSSLQNAGVAVSWRDWLYDDCVSYRLSSAASFLGWR